MLKIRSEIVEKIFAHAKRERPIEACGYLAGAGGIITAHYELTNVDESREHFSFDPKEQFDVVRDTRTKGLQVFAVYHSHPETPARPSSEDVRLAYDPGISYVIASLAGGEETIRSFRIVDSKVEEEELETVNEN